MNRAALDLPGVTGRLCALPRAWKVPVAAFWLLTLVPGLAWAERTTSQPGWPVQGKAAGHAVYAFGPFDLYSVSPTYFPNLEMQAGNQRERVKITPKKSWEIQSHYIGLTPTRLPSSRAAEIEPYHPVFFIDEDPATIGFAGLPEGDPATARAFVRILLPSVTPIRAVVLVTAPGKPLPATFSVVTHRWERWDREQPDERGQWQTVYEERNGKPVVSARATNAAPNVYKPEERLSQGKGAESRSYSFPIVSAREIWIYSPASLELGEIRVLDASGRNVAAFSAGATVEVSRRSHLFWFDEETQRHMWPMTYDLGLKWLRVNYYLTPLIWPYVEREKGLYVIDPYTEEVLRDAAEKGITICLTLGPPDHPLYESASQEERIAAFCRYVRFMVGRFHTFVRYFEILNEYYNQDSYEVGKAGPFREVAQEYARIAIPAANVIREESPDARIILCGPCPLAVDWIEAALQTGLAPLVDVISWHPYQLTEPPEVLDRPRHPWAGAELARYADAVDHLRKVAQRQGFRGTFQANEAGAYAIHQLRSTALVSAKYMARSLVLHSALRIPVFWNETVSLFRPAWQPFFWLGQPAAQPDYSYYVLRTLCTLMDGMEPATEHVRVEVYGAKTGAEIEWHVFEDRTGRTLLALWRPLRSTEHMEGIEGALVVRGVSPRRVRGFELFNGEVQELEFQQETGGVRLEGLRVRDYPLLIEFEPFQSAAGSETRLAAGGGTP